MRRTLALLGMLSAWTGCIVHTDGDYACDGPDTYQCYVEYDPLYGYSRVCDWAPDPALCVDIGGSSGDSGARRQRTGSASSGDTSSSTPAPPTSVTPPARGGAGSSGTGNSETSSSTDPTDLPCTHDGQCGTGLCIGGDCFYGCADDSSCGTGDFCSVVQATPVCQVNDDPTVDCKRSADCSFGQECLNASCHDICSTTTDCSNDLDRCIAGLCVPDRRIVSECLLDRDCSAGEVCIDATCQVR
jgi:hypothetical protein